MPRLRILTVLTVFQSCSSRISSKCSPPPPLPSAHVSVANLLPFRYMGSWKVLREPESARRYCGTAISLVSFCLRSFSLPSDKAPTRFTDRQRTVLENYRQYLTTSKDLSEDDVRRFQSALFCVLFREHAVDIDVTGRLSCPVQCYIALLSLRQAGHFIKPGLVTQPISRLLYLSRCAVLQVALCDRSDAEGFVR